MRKPMETYVPFRYALTFFVALVAWVTVSAQAFAIDIREVTTPSGIKAWLVEDYTVPIVSISMEFGGGAAGDPEGMEGLSSVLAAMMDEGAGDLDTAALKAEIEQRGFELGFRSGRDDFSGGIRMLASDTERGFELLEMMLSKPRFEAASLERVRASYIAAAKREDKDPDAILGNRFRSVLFGDHPYGRPTRGTPESLEKITREHLITHHRRMLAKDNVHIGVVGAISSEELVTALEKVFADLPAQSDLPDIADIKPDFGEREHVQFNSPQTLVSFALPGLKREDPDFFAAHIMTHILGGGSFSSWLYDEVREKRGLVYGIGASLRTLDSTAYIGGGFATRPDQAAEALEITLAQIKRMATNGPTQAELDAAKKFVYGTYAINNLDTSRKIADVLVGLQAGNLGIDYIDRRGATIDAVTLEDVRRVATRLLSQKPTILTLGPGDA